MSLKEIRRVLDVVGVAERYAPGLKLDQKSYHRLHRWIGHASPAYLREFWTTLPRLDGSGSTIYRPTITDGEGEARNEFAVVAHEVMHANQTTRFQAKLGGRLGALAYAAAYGFPQVFAVLGALWGVLWAVCNLAGVDLPWAPAMLAVCAAPWPAPYRIKSELEAYKVSAAADYWYRGGMSALETEAWVRNVTAHFTGPNYYYMGWCVGPWVRRQLRAWFKALRNGAGETATPFLIEIKVLCDRYRAEDGG